MPYEIEYWTWPDAFNKFGFDDGDGVIHTDEVKDVISGLGYECEEYHGMHNRYIADITKDGKTIYPPYAPGQGPGEELEPGYANPMEFLPKEIIEALNQAFGTGEWWG